MEKSNTQDIKTFKKELKDLLKKYDANILMSVHGDTHGIYNEQIQITVKNKVVAKNDEGDYYFTYRDV